MAREFELDPNDRLVGSRRAGDLDVGSRFIEVRVAVQPVTCLPVG